MNPSHLDFLAPFGGTAKFPHGISYLPVFTPFSAGVHGRRVTISETIKVVCQCMQDDISN
jgi:hypothetical protein